MMGVRSHLVCRYPRLVHCSVSFILCAVCLMPPCCICVASFGLKLLCVLPQDCGSLIVMLAVCTALSPAAALSVTLRPDGACVLLSGVSSGLCRVRFERFGVARVQCGLDRQDATGHNADAAREER